MMSESVGFSTDVAYLSFGGDLTLDTKDLWPDGDAPFQWTVDDVVELIEKDGGLSKVLHGWFLEDALTLTIWANGDKAEVSFRD